MQLVIHSTDLIINPKKLMRPDKFHPIMLKKEEKKTQFNILVNIEGVENTMKHGRAMIAKEKVTHMVFL